MGVFDDTLVLTDRQLAILRAVVEEYVATAQPVSSASIADLPEVHASSATVRNVMARLEELGLLLQPHTSAGRIPTDLGYRYYVDHLLTLYRGARRRPARMALPRDPGVAATCKLLGELTKYTALALAPTVQEHRVQHLELAPVGLDQVLVMLVTDSRQVLHSLSTVPDRPNAAQVRQLNDALNEAFRGQPLSAVTEEAVAAAVAKLPHVPRGFSQQAPGLLRRGLEQEAGERFVVEGEARLFEQQEFADMPKLRALMAALHEESAFEQLFSRTRTGEISVSIGAENPHPGLQDCAIIFTSYRISETATGRVGILGPRRMPYQRVIRTLDAVVNNLDAQLGKGEG